MILDKFLRLKMLLSVERCAKKADFTYLCGCIGPKFGYINDQTTDIHY